jgi:hypothetical protein
MSKHTKKNARKRVTLRAIVESAKAGCSCACGESDPAALDFHHTDPSKKDTAIAKMVSVRCGSAALLAEIAKCVIICANCHRKGHAGRPRSEHVSYFAVPATLLPCSDASNGYTLSGTNAAVAQCGGTAIACVTTAKP